MNYLKQGRRLGKSIVTAYKQFGVEIDIVGMKFISNLFRYIFEIRIAPGTRFQSIFQYAQDIQIALGLPILYPFREGIHIRLAVSEYDIHEMSLLKILRSSVFLESQMDISYAVGYDLWGNMCIVDLVKLRHLLIAGPTGTGKSIALQCLILSIIVKCPVSCVNLMLFDIGGNSLSQFSSLPHLSYPIIKEPETGIRVLDTVVYEMEQRLLLDETELRCRPYLVCIMDEFVSMISNITDARESQYLVSLINNLLRRGRKTKIILVLATHNPTLKNAKVDLSEIVARIAFQCAKHHNSSTALGIPGADKLPGDGAMLFKSQKGILSLQGAFITPQEIQRILDEPPVGYDDSNKFVITEPDIAHEQTVAHMVFGGNTPVQRDTKELVEIIMWAVGRDNISANQIQKQFRMGNRAAAVVEELFSLGIVGEKFANQPRKVIPKSVEDLSPEVIQLLKKHEIDLNSINSAENTPVT